MFIAATCTTIAAMLSYASGGDTITLTGNCGQIEISKTYAKALTIDAAGAKVRGLRITGQNVVWNGGVISAPGTLDTTGPNGYAVKISGRNIVLKGATITAAKKGLVIDGAVAVRIEKNRFWRLREDGIIASDSKALTVTHNSFSESRPLPSTCTAPHGGVTYGLAARKCAGTWKDGNHADAVQMRNGIENAFIAHNTVQGETQGIAQMDTAGDRPLRAVTIRSNTIATDGYHRITLTQCLGCVIRDNTVRKAPGSTKKAVILPGKATRCGNFAEDEKVSDGVCPA